MKYANFVEYAKANNLSAEDVVNWINNVEGNTGVYAGELLDLIDHEAEEPEYAVDEIRGQISEFLEEDGYEEVIGDFGELYWELREDDDEVWV